MYKVEFTKAEAESIMIQIGARIDKLREIQKNEARNENIERVIQMEEFLKPIISAKEKVEKEFYKF